MKFAFCFALAVAALIAPSAAEVPQEHSHEKQLNDFRQALPFNSQSIRGNGVLPDPVFALLGNAAADKNAPDGDGICLQQDMADTAISLAAGDSKKIAAALKFRALERNTIGIGKLSDACTKEPVSEILKGLSQHQDPASDNADEINKEVELTLAKKLAEIGEDPLEALETQTFVAGDKNDFSFKGNSCSDENDKAGCIFTQNLGRAVATEEEIQAAVAGNASTAPAAEGKPKPENDGKEPEPEPENESQQPVPENEDQEPAPEGDGKGKAKSIIEEMIKDLNELDSILS